MKTKSSAKPWLIFFACMLFSAGSIGMFMNCTGIIFTAVISEFGFKAGNLSIYYTIRFFTTAVTVGFMSKKCLEKPKFWIPLMGVSGCLSFVAMTLFTQLWQWYIAAVFCSIGLCCTFVVIPIVINNWFKKFNGLLIGLAMSASGAAGAILSPVLSAFVSQHGWRFAASFLGICGLIFTASPAILWIRTTPEEIGEVPYGYDPEKEAAMQARALNKEVKDIKVPARMFFIIVAAIMFSIILSQFMNQIPLFATSVGYSLTIGATLSSACMIGNLSGKILFGALSDKLGVFRTSYTVLAGTMAAYILLAFFQGSIPRLWAGCVLFGISFSLGTTAPSLVFIQVYGENGYKSKLSGLQSINSVSTALLSSLIPFIFDFTGSFTPVFILGICTTALAIVNFTLIVKYLKTRER